MHVKNQQLEPDMEQPTGSKLGKEYIKAMYCHPAYLTYMQSTSFKMIQPMLGWMKHSWNGDCRENTNNLRYAEDITLMAESEELKSCLMKVKEESEKFGLKFSIPKANIMASGPIASWQIDGETIETVTDFIFGGCKTTINGDCSHVIKRCLLLRRKAMTNLSSVQSLSRVRLPATP